MIPVEAYGNYWENKLDETADSMLGFIGIETGVMYRQLCESDRKLKVEIAGEHNCIHRSRKSVPITEMNLQHLFHVPDRDIYFSANEKGLSYSQIIRR